MPVGYADGLYVGRYAPVSLRSIHNLNHVLSPASNGSEENGRTPKDKLTKMDVIDFLQKIDSTLSEVVRNYNDGMGTDCGKLTEIANEAAMIKVDILTQWTIEQG